MYFLSIVSVLFCFTYTVQAVSQGALRFYRNGVPDTNQSWSSGVVQIYYSSDWGNICDDDSFGADEADVICHQLGYTGASSYSNTGTTSMYGNDSSSTVFDDVSCSSSSYLAITQCSFSTSNIPVSCNDDTDAIVTCNTSRIWDSPIAGDIRLTGGDYSNEGLLEVYCNGEWGTVCDDSFSTTEARIACAQLGYNYYRSYDHLTLRGTSSQNIWLNTVTSCSTSTDVCLTECGGCPSSAITSCDHTEDITLECRYYSSVDKVNSVLSDSCQSSSTGPAPDGTVRLYRNGIADTSQSWSSGIVQIYNLNNWGNICDETSFSSDEANVICHQLGYTGASSYSNTGTTLTWGTDNSITNFDDVACSSSSYFTITQCIFSTSISASCDDTHDVIVNCYSGRIWDSPIAGDIRLTGGRYSNEGLLEVYCNGEWGTVCDNSFSNTEARVTCRQLGYNFYGSINHLTLQGNSSQSIWLNTDTGCSSTDNCLNECGACPSNAITNCDHTEDVTLECRYSTSYSKVTSTTTDNCYLSAHPDTSPIGPTGTVRLYRNGVPDTSQSWSSGIVQIYYGSSWGNICDDVSFGSDEADVICHQLGYTGASSYSNTGTTSTWGTDYSSTSIHDVSCTSSNYLTITQCSFSTTVTSNCNDASDVIVNCYASRIWNNPVAGDIRLTGGTYSSQGLLEVYCNGEWGTVCDNSFSTTEARIACQQLGYNYYRTYDQLSLQGSSSQNIWLNTATSCSSSTDVCLTECGACPSSAITSCSHSEDVTLECQYSSSYSKSSTIISDSCRASSTGPAPVGTVRLFRNGNVDTSQSWSSGIVEIYYGSSWGNICDETNFGSDEADVICHQLAYTGASSYSNAGATSIWGSDNSVTAMDDVSCPSPYLTITQCSFSTSISATCGDPHDVIVTCYTTRVWNSPIAGDIRLTGGTYSNQGLLEVYCNGEWGTVCDNSFSTTQARIACRQLGYTYYVNYDHLTLRGNSSQSVWLNTQTSCSSSDVCLTECDSCPSSALTICSHSEDITLECYYSSSYSKPTTTTNDNCYSSANPDSTAAAPIGTLRLYRDGFPDTSQSWSSGIVQIYYGSSWGNICDDDSFGADEADVICHQLGYTGASSYSNTGTTSTYGTDYSDTNIDSVNCASSTYLTVVSQCTYNSGSSVSSSCTDSNDVTVLCYTTRIWDTPSTGDVRLTGGRYSSEGLLEVYCNGEWGTVCDDSFSTTQARVACRQLGYNDYDQYDHLPYQGNSSQSIWLRSLSGCSFSTDTCLTSCGGCPSQSVTACSHSEDVTLACEFDSFYSKVFTDTSDTCSITATDPTTFSTVDTSNLVGAIVGSVVGLTVCILVLTFVPICVCTCIGVGVGAAGSRGTRATRLLRTTPTQQNKSTSNAANLSQEDTTAIPLVQQCYPANPAQQGEKVVYTGSGLPEQYYPSKSPSTAPQGGYPTSYPPTQQSNYYSQQPQEPPPAYPTAPTAPPQQEGYPLAYPPATTYPPQQSPPPYS